MPIADPRRFGADLRLLRNLDLIKSNRDPGSDLGTTRRRLTGNEEFDRQSGAANQIDLGTFDGSDNLVQALLLRFLTPMGALSLLGHPDYGCRLAELVGELNSETNRNRAKLFVLQALALEPRVKQVLSVDVTQNKKDPAQIDIKVLLLAIDSVSPLNLVFPFFLERGVIP